MGKQTDGQQHDRGFEASSSSRQRSWDSEEKEMGLTGQKRSLFLDLSENWGFHSVTDYQPLLGCKP